MDKNAIDTPSREIDLGNIPVHLRRTLNGGRWTARRSAEEADKSCRSWTLQRDDPPLWHRPAPADWPDGARRCRSRRRLPRETRPSGEAEAGTRRLGGAGHLRPVHAEAGLGCKPRGRHSLEAQAQLRSEGIALDIKTLRSTAYRYAARARAAQQSELLGKRVASVLDGGRVRRKKQTIPTGRNRSSSSCTSSATMGPDSLGDRRRSSPC